MLRYDLIATDIDGTLLTSRREVSPRTRAALRAAREEGSVLMMASGRPEAGLRNLARRLGIGLDGLVLSANNGASVVDAVTGEVYSQTPISAELATRALELAKEFGMAAMTPVGETIYVTDRNGYYFEHEEESNGMRMEVSHDFATLGEPIPKVLLSAEPQLMARHRDAIVAALGSDAEAVLSAPFYLEVNAPGVTKGVGLAGYIAARGLNPSRVIAFGDSENDIAMLREAGVGVAMGNALPHVKEIADHVTLSNDEDGIAEALALPLLPHHR